jgi:hypothetical protein
MRALCGAIITAGAFIGLGLTALGIGTRYSRIDSTKSDPPFIVFKNMDGPLTFTLVFLSVAALIGLGITIFGLCYHHQRRCWEHERDLWERERVATRDRTNV